MTLFQVTTLQELVETIRRCACRETKCATCRINLDRMDLVLDRAYRDVMRDNPIPKERQ